MEELKKVIREVPDFPKPGILFYDITTLLADGEAFRRVIDILAERYEGQKIDRIVGIDARGFIFSAALAYKLGLGMAPVRKKGKLPFRTVSASYELEYGTDTIEMHEDGVKPGERVLLLDDLLATGGTAKAAVELIEGCKGEVVECAFVVELTFLEGRKKLGARPVYSILRYDT